MKLVVVLTMLSLMNIFGADSFPLWNKDVPGALGTAEKDVPTLTVYLPEEGKATGAAMVICPGGGYGGLAQHEGKDYAEWLATNGVAGFVLKVPAGPGGVSPPCNAAGCSACDSDGPNARRRMESRSKAGRDYGIIRGWASGFNFADSF